MKNMNPVTIQAILSLISVPLTHFRSVWLYFPVTADELCSECVVGKCLSPKKYTLSYFSSVLIASFQSVKKIFICYFSHVM